MKAAVVVKQTDKNYCNQRMIKLQSKRSKCSLVYVHCSKRNLGNVSKMWLIINKWHPQPALASVWERWICPHTWCQSLGCSFDWLRNDLWRNAGFNPVSSPRGYLIWLSSLWDWALCAQECGIANWLKMYPLVGE